MQLPVKAAVIPRENGESRLHNGCVIWTVGRVKIKMHLSCCVCCERLTDFEYRIMLADSGVSML